MSKSTTSAPAETALVPTTPVSPLAIVKDILGTVAQADEDPTERMAQFILNNPPERWEELWAGLPSIRDAKGDTFTIEAVRARESDFEGPLGVYLILEVRYPGAEETNLISCSSQMSMVQILALVKGKRLPAKVQVVEKDKPTKAGFRPIHLRYLGAQEAPTGDPGAVVSEQ